MNTRRYRAFISYSHRDESWARWLQRAVESYRLPAKLVGQKSAGREIPKRLSPIFRDREDLTSASDLPGKVREALRAAEALIVVCSPAAAASKWVNREIEEFRSLGRGDRIFAVIVDGDPASQGAEACFPPALLAAEGDDAVEPLAADARKWADGRLLAKLKLIAGILDIPLDALRRRDLQRRQRRWVAITIAAVLSVLVVTLAVTSRIAAEKRRAFAEELVGYKLTDLSGRLKAVAPGEELARLGEWSEAELAEMMAAAGGDEGSLFERAMALRDSGLAARQRGDREDALRDLRHSWALLAMLVRGDPEHRTWLFELGQAEYWLGALQLEAGNVRAAKRSFDIYAEISRRLLRLEPENADRVLEMAYALSNLGMLEVIREPSDRERALQFLQAALEYNQIALVLDPGNALYRSELEQSHANVADAQVGVCDLGGALNSRMENTQLARAFYEEAPSEERRKRRLAFALGGLAKVQEQVGLVDLALANWGQSERLLRELAASAPGNADYPRLLVSRRSSRVNLLADSGAWEQALQLAREVNLEWEALFSGGRAQRVQARIDRAEFHLAWSLAEYEGGDRDLADELLARATQALRDILDDSPQLAAAQRQLVMATYYLWQRHGQSPPADLRSMLPDAQGPGNRAYSCDDANLAARQAVVRGEFETAGRYTSFLLSRGYFNPGFIRFCRAQDLCDEE